MSAAKLTRVQIVSMWLLSRSSPLGNVTETLREFASPGFAFSTAWIVGMTPPIDPTAELQLQLRSIPSGWSS